MSNSVKQGDEIGRWKILSYLGGGSNGEVWEAEDRSGKRVALKILRSRIYSKRFLDEIKLYRSLGDQPGILPLVDSHIPTRNERKSGDRAWLAMEVAEPLTDHLGSNPDLALVVTAIKEYAATLISLAGKEIYHRDIKPSNLYWLNDAFAIGDFGIADFPDKSGLTQPGDKVGPANFLAPEMVDYSDGLLSGPADVYSLTKTMWAIATGRRYPPPGELRRDNPDLRLSSYVKDPRAVALELILERATSHDPTRRPTMQDFLDELIWWEQPSVSVKPDLPDYRGEIQRIREAKRMLSPETDEQRTERRRLLALTMVRQKMYDELHELLRSSGLEHLRPGTSTNDVWPFDGNYGGDWTSTYWGIDTIASPWLEFHAGILHQNLPVKDENDLKLIVILAAATLQSRENYAYYFESFDPESMQADRRVEQIKLDIKEKLADVISDFLTRCATDGISR